MNVVTYSDATCCVDMVFQYCFCANNETNDRIVANICNESQFVYRLSSPHEGPSTYVEAKEGEMNQIGEYDKLVRRESKKS